MRTINIDEIEKIIDEAKGTNINLLFVGDTGIGKTEAIKKYCAKNKLYLKCLNLSTIDPSECLGIPVKNTREYNGKTYDVLTTAIPNWVFDLKEHEKQGCVLFLDEFFCCQPSVMNAFLNFLVEKRVEDIEIDVTILAATNIGTYTFDPAENMLSRFCMFYVENNSYADYLKKKYKNTYLLNNYKDNTDKTSHTIFEPRSLKPRCQEALCLLKNSEIINYFYEGFTNMEMPKLFSSIEKVNNIINTFAFKGYVNENNYTAIAKMIIDTFSRCKTFDKIIASIYDKNLRKGIEKEINELTGCLL